MSSSEKDSYSMIFTSLKHPIRRKILRILFDAPQSFSDLQKQFKIESSHLTYHLDCLGNLLWKTDDGKYGLSSLGEAAVSMMKNVEEPPTILHLPFKSGRRISALRPLTFILVCCLIASLVFNGIVLLRYNELSTANNGLNKAYNDLLRTYDELNQEDIRLNRTFNDLKKAYDELQQAYYSLSGGIRFRTIQSYGTSAIPAYYVVQNESDLTAMWNKLMFQVFVGNGPEVTPTPPTINFTESTLIAVFRGWCGSSGYDIRITGIFDTGQSILVEVEKTDPGTHCYLADVVTYPSQMVTIAKTDRPVIFETNERTIDCS